MVILQNHKNKTLILLQLRKDMLGHTSPTKAHETCSTINFGKWSNMSVLFDSFSLIIYISSVSLCEFQQFHLYI